MLNLNYYIIIYYLNIERIHIYLQGKKVKRLDKSLHALMKFIRYRSIDRLIVIHKGKITSKIKELRKRHNHMFREMVMKATEDSWDIVSEKYSEMYTMNRLKISCDCQIKCQDCLSCIHCYTCSCIDSAIKWNMCKHIHLVCQFQLYNIRIQENNGMLTNCLFVNKNLNNMPNTEDEHNNETSDNIWVWVGGHR